MKGTRHGRDHNSKTDELFNSVPEISVPLKIKMGDSTPETTVKLKVTGAERGNRYVYNVDLQVEEIFSILDELIVKKISDNPSKAIAKGCLATLREIVGK